MKRKSKTIFGENECALGKAVLRMAFPNATHTAEGGNGRMPAYSSAKYFVGF